ncbi:MAG: DUF2298 domain-containing protein [Salinirussus sp.]
MAMEVGLVALWLVVLLLLGAIALPLASWLFPGGDPAALSVPLALAVVGVVGYLVGHVAFGWPAALAGVAALIGGSALATDRVGTDWRAFLEPAAVFTAAFLFVVAVRAVDPAAAVLPLAIGEKFLDFGLLRSLGRTPALPPEDMWFAGRSVRYYYGGHMTVSLLGTLAGTAGRYAYNLGLAGFYAALVTGAYGLAGSIVAPETVRIPRRVAAGLAAFLVGIAGNLKPAAKLLGWLLPDGAAAAVAGSNDAPSSIVGWTPADFWYFEASRVIPVDPRSADPVAAATEFPLFSWLNGDLHAHMMSQPFLLVVAALLLAYWRTPPERTRRRAALLAGALPPVAGLVAVTNVWSFPTAGGLTLLTVQFAPGDPIDLLPDRDRLAPLQARLAPREGIVDELRRLGLSTVAAAAAVGIAMIWTLPFWVGVIPGGPSKTVGIWAVWTPVEGFLLVHGAFLAAFVPYLVRGIAATRERTRLAAGTGVAVAVGSALLGAPAVGIVVPVGLAAWWLLRRGTVGPEAMLVLAGAGLVLLVELVTIEGERFNVVFKTYSDVWLLWSVAGGVVLARLAAGWPAALLDVSGRRWRWTGRVLAVVVVLVTATYAAFALPSHFETASPTVDAEGPTLDATAYLEVEYPAEAPAIRWLDGREGRPVIVTAAPGGYRWRPAEGKGASAPASLTGLPTVLGWFHEAQYRGQSPYQKRLADVRAIYTGAADEQARLLERYDVRYVYVGPAERAQYGAVTITDRPFLSVANRWPEVTVYRVDHSALRSR